jgi:hypothetical protein
MAPSKSSVTSDPVIVREEVEVKPRKMMVTRAPVTTDALVPLPLTTSDESIVDSDPWHVKVLPLIVNPPDVRAQSALAT